MFFCQYKYKKRIILKYFINSIKTIPYVKHNTNFRIIVDPSHASGLAYMVPSMSKASLVAGCDGLIIECHTNPSDSLCDSKQTIDLDTLDEIIKFNKNNN